MQDYRNFSQKLYDRIFNVKMDVLNQKQEAQAIQNLDAELARLGRKLQGEVIQEALIDYEALQQSATYQDFRALTAALKAFDLTSLQSREERLAFWLNLYNVLVIDAIITYKIQASVNEVKGFFRRASYQIGAYVFNLDDIEHGILRANAGHPLLIGAHFSAKDPRRQFVMETLDIRIHFALVCGAISCPPINFYQAEKIDAQLDIAAKNFINQELRLDEEKAVVHLSRLFHWYGNDFGAGRWALFGFMNREALLHTLLPYLSDKQVIQQIQASEKAPKLAFSNYDWHLNRLA